MLDAIVYVHYHITFTYNIIGYKRALLICTILYIEHMYFIR